MNSKSPRATSSTARMSVCREKSRTRLSIDLLPMFPSPYVITPAGASLTGKSFRAFEYVLRISTPPCGVALEIWVMLSVPRMSPSRTLMLAMIVMRRAYPCELPLSALGAVDNNLASSHSPSDHKPCSMSNRGRRSRLAPRNDTNGDHAGSPRTRDRWLHGKRQRRQQINRRDND